MRKGSELEIRGAEKQKARDPNDKFNFTITGNNTSSFFLILPKSIGFLTMS